MAILSSEESVACGMETPLADRYGTGKNVCRVAAQGLRNCTLQDFLERVIYDGRFLQTFTLEPERIAELLGLDLSSDIALNIRGRDPSLLLAEATDKMTRIYGELKKAGVDEQGPPRTHIGASIGIFIVCIALAGAEPALVYDQSPNADAKL